MFKINFIYVFCLVVNIGYCSYCGLGSIPTGLEVTLRGSLILECARSPCMGVSPQHDEAISTTNFVDGDGYLANTDDPIATNPFNQVTCEPTFSSATCNPNTQWVGGIIPGAGVNAGGFTMACCNYLPLQFSRSVGVALISNGQIFHGGNTNAFGEFPGYDYIANIIPRTNSDGTITYVTYIKRLLCLPRQTIPLAPLVPAQPAIAAAAPVQSASSYYYPVASTSFYCFSGDSTVLTSEGKRKQLKNLKIGEWIYGYEDGYPVLTKVDSWIHRKISEKAEFLHIHLNNNKSIKITKNHLIYKSKCQNNEENIEKTLVYAEELKVGDCLYVQDTKTNSVKHSRIINIDIIQEIGYYSPKTITGNLFINDIFVSCYSNLDNQELHLGYDLIKEFMLSDFMKSIYNLIGYNIYNNNNEEDIELIPGISTLMLLSEYAIGYYK